MPTEAEAATVDGFLGGRIELVQPARGHRAGLDAALLQAMVPDEAAGKLVDIGTGTGVVALSVACRAANLSAIGMDIDPDLIALAQRSLAMPRNLGFSDRVRFVVADASAPRPQRENAGLPDNMADWVTMNPPYERSGRVRQSPDKKKSRAHVGDEATLAAWLRTASGLLRTGGRLAMIHRADKLEHLLAAMSSRIGGISIVPVYPRERESATRVLVNGTKGSRSPLEIRPGIILHENDGSWTPYAREVLDGRRCLA